MSSLLRSVLLIGLVAACVSPRVTTVRGDAEYPGELRPGAALGAEVLWRQTVRARWAEGEESFDAAVQVVEGEFLVLGLSPAGQVGFVLRYADGAVTVENHSGRDLVIPARSVLLDVQRALFPWIEGPVPTDGERIAERFGERIEERYEDGLLRERSFERLDGVPAGAVVVRYEWPTSGPNRLAPPRLELDNGWFGYTLLVTTHEETRLEPEGESQP